MQELVVAINRLSDKITTLGGKIDFLTRSSKGQLENIWLDNQELMDMMHISVRTMQNLRSQGILPYSKIKGKVYYKATDIKKLLETNYILR